MRKFTKEHNDVEWLFPFAQDKDSANAIFDEMEDFGNYYFDMANYDEKDKDLAIDCFMKGASVMMQMYTESIMRRTVHNIYEGLCKVDKKDKDNNYYRFIQFLTMIEYFAMKSSRECDIYENSRDYLYEKLVGSGFDSEDKNYKERIKMMCGNEE